MKPVRYAAVAVLACIATFLFLRYVVSPSDFYGRELYSAEEVSKIAAFASASPAEAPTPIPETSASVSPSSVPSSASPDPDTVYIAGEGKKTYHKTPTCSGMKDPVAIPFSETTGMNPCKKCFPSDDS